MPEPTITPRELFRTLWNSDEAQSDCAHESVDAQRIAESRWMRLLPEPLVRRIWKGFARSRTIHPETARFLYGIVLASHAKTVFETGTYWGYSTTYIAAALEQAGDGIVHSFDLDPVAGSRIPADLRHRVRLHLGRPANEVLGPLMAEQPPDIFFQDSVHDLEGVASELTAARPHLHPKTVVLFHDWVAEGVREAAHRVLVDHHICRLEIGDPQGFGVAWHRNHPALSAA